MTASASHRLASKPLKIRDISPAVEEQAAVFPGDTGCSQQLNFSLSADCPVNVNSITLSPHTSAHAHALHDLPARVLLRTTRTASQSWESFTAVAPETLAQLATKNIALIGIDTPSIDPADSPDLPSHHQLLAHGLRVLENLVLDEVPEGDCELIALPLKLMRADASPVRAILRELPKQGAILREPAPHPRPLPKGARE